MISVNSPAVYARARFFLCVTTLRTTAMITNVILRAFDDRGTTSGHGGDVQHELIHEALRRRFHWEILASRQHDNSEA